MDILSLTKEARIYNGKTTNSLTSAAGKTGQPREKNETRTLSNTIHKNKLKMDERSKCKTRNYKLLEDNIGKTLSDINQSKILYDPPPRILEIKAKINTWVLIKSFCTTKETISKVKRQPSERKKIIANEATDKGLISKIYKQLLQLNSRKVNDPIKK